MKNVEKQKLNSRIHQRDLIKNIIEENGDSLQIVSLKMYEIAAELFFKISPNELSEEQADELSDKIYDSWGILDTKDIQELINEVIRNDRR